eukprot:263744-Amphidinium_carterae.1
MVVQSIVVVSVTVTASDFPWVHDRDRSIGPRCAYEFKVVGVVVCPSYGTISTEYGDVVEGGWVFLRQQMQTSYLPYIWQCEKLRRAVFGCDLKQNRGFFKMSVSETCICVRFEHSSPSPTPRIFS